MLPKDLQDGVLEAISIQALGQVLFTQGPEFALVLFGKNQVNHFN